MEASVSEIFENHSVDEIRRICIDIRNDVENRKMELRFLVGERHRDVIEASDNILHMKKFSQNITEKLAQLEGSLIYKAPAVADISRLKGQNLGNPKNLIASQLKLLLDIPEMIWSALDEMDYTGAVEFFLLGRHLSVKMQLTSEMAAAHVNAHVLVKRQWAALDHIESTIASACRKQLALPTVSKEILVQASTALLVLEDQMIHDALNEFLAGRMTALSCVLEVDKSSNGSVMHDVEQCLSLVVRLLLQTVEVVTKLFLPDGQIFALLNVMSKWCPRETAWFNADNLFENLPQNVANYHITQTPAQSRQPKSPNFTQSEETFSRQPSGIRACPLSYEDLANPFQNWWKSALGFCQQHLSAFITSHPLSLTELVNIRRNLLANLSADSNNGDENSTTPHPLGCDVDLWTELFQDLFLNHLEVLLNATLTEVFMNFETSLLSLAKSLDKEQEETQNQGCDENRVLSPDADPASRERDLGSFVWSESLDSDATLDEHLNTENQSPLLSDEIPGHLEISPNQLVMAYFACLMGRRDLLPPPQANQKNSTQLPAPLLWRLSRLLESAATNYVAFDCRGRGEETGQMMRGTVCASRNELNLKRRLVTPQLKEICGTLNNRLCEMVATSASEEVATWKILLRAVEDFMEKCCDLAQRVRTELTSDSEGRGAFCVARACFCLLDVYPALGATVVTANARMLAEEENGISFTPWTDVSKLRQVWISTSQKLRSIAARLSLTAILRATVESPTFDNLFTSLSSALSSNDPINESDTKLVGISSQWFEIMLEPSSEESDAAGAVVRLKIPTHPSCPLQETLFSMARRLTDLSVYVLPRGSLSEAFDLRLAESIINIYCRLVEAQGSELTQSQAFQLLFDVRFVLRLLVWPLASTSKRYSTDSSPTVESVSETGQNLLKRLEDAVDPFDLEMSSERLNSAIGHAVRNSIALYAALLPVTSTSPSEGEGKGSRVEDFSNLAFLSLTPTSKFSNGEDTGKAGRTSLFGLVPFSLSQLRPPTQATTVVKAQSKPPQEKPKKTSSTSRDFTSDFSWFGGLSFT